jgi:hypothetical protein
LAQDTQAGNEERRERSAGNRHFERRGKKRHNGKRLIYRGMRSKVVGRGRWRKLAKGEKERKENRWEAKGLLVSEGTTSKTGFCGLAFSTCFSAYKHNMK